LHLFVFFRNLKFTCFFFITITKCVLISEIIFMNFCIFIVILSIFIILTWLILKNLFWHISIFKFHFVNIFILNKISCIYVFQTFLRNFMIYILFTFDLATRWIHLFIIIKIIWELSFWTWTILLTLLIFIKCINNIFVH